MKKYNIAVIGKSRSGKSTWIASLYEREIGEKLRSICDENTEGQTKICTYYTLQTQLDSQLHIEEIAWNIEELSEIITQEDFEFPTNIMKYFQIPNLTQIDRTEEDKTDNEPLKEYFASESYKKQLKAIDAYDFIKEIICDIDIMNKNIINHITLAGSAISEVREIMEQYDIERYTRILR